MRRFFNKRQKTALWLAAAGRCEQCGQELEKSWHADHWEPWAAGGETDVINGQALCASCNLKKGGRSVFVKWPFDYPMRDWQERCERDFRTARQIQRDYLIVACPGAGKTDGTLPLVVDLLSSRMTQRVVIVCPTEEVCNQWKEKASRFGIQLMRESPETKDMHGVVVTYAQVVNGWDNHRTFCAREKTVVVFDEIHHCADPKPWGDKIRQAFDHAEYRIALSGTPFREDGHPIPFVTYENGWAVPDFTYNYQDALNDKNVCRLAFFPLIDGSGEWLINGQRKFARLEDTLGEERRLNDADASALLRTILNPRGEWIATTIRAAREKTEKCRQVGHADAGELWLCMDQNHARSIAEVIHKMTGEAPVLVISEDPKASDKIEAFRQGRQKCLVSVRMVCEGVDIPRLRVLAYATNYTTDMFFRQALGRIVRYVENLDEQAAYFFIPRIEKLIQLALEVIEERNHFLQAEALFSDEIRNLRRDGGEFSARSASLFEPLDSEGRLAGVIGQGEEFPQDALDQARSVLQHTRSSMQAEELAMALFKAGLLQRNAPAPETAKDYEKPLESRKKDLRNKINHIVGKWAYLDGVEHQSIHAEWIRISKVRTRDATIEDLQRKYEWVLQGLADAQQRRGHDS